MKYAVIDIGTNSTRLYLAEGKTKQHKISKDLISTRLGEGITDTPLLLEVPMRRTIEAISGFVKKAREAGVKDEGLFIYATAVVRESTNREDFANRVKAETGIALDIIPGETEALIAYLGAAGGQENCAVIDIGGGSTEVITRTDSLKALSLKIGCVRMMAKFEKLTPSEIREQVLKEYIPMYKDSTDIEKVDRLLGVSGTPCALAALAQGRNDYCPDLIQNYRLTREQIDTQTELLWSLPLDKRKEYMGHYSHRADILPYGCIFLSAFAEYYGFDSVMVSDRDSLEGYLTYKTELK